MERKKFVVPNISCGHCLMNIKKELEAISGVRRVEGDASIKEVLVEWDPPATIGRIKEAFEKIHFPVAG